MRTLAGLCAHFSFALALYFAGTLVLDWYNPLMNFTGNQTSTALLAVFCLCSAAGSICRFFERPPRREKPPPRPDAPKP